MDTWAMSVRLSFIFFCLIYFFLMFMLVNLHKKVILISTQWVALISALAHTKRVEAQTFNTQKTFLLLLLPNCFSLKGGVEWLRTKRSFSQMEAIEVCISEIMYKAEAYQVYQHQMETHNYYMNKEHLTLDYCLRPKT